MSKADQTNPNLLSLLLCTDEIIVTSTEKKTFFRVVQYKNSIRLFLFMTTNFGADSQRKQSIYFFNSTEFMIVSSTKAV